VPQQHEVDARHEDEVHEEQRVVDGEKPEAGAAPRQESRALAGWLAHHTF
jgi:hypothetical protein